MLARFLRLAAFMVSLFLLFQIFSLSTAGRQNNSGDPPITSDSEKQIYLPLIAQGLHSSSTPVPSPTLLPTSTPISTPSPTSSPITATHSISLVDMPFLAERWYLVNVGQTIGGKITGTLGSDVDAPLAWTLSQGDPDVIVAVLDTGIAFDHPDLSDKIWSKPKETINGQDDDGNGYIDDKRGWDFVDNDNDPQDSRTKILGDEVGIFHGTAVASIIASLAPHISIMPLRAISDFASDEKLAKAVLYARDNGARVVNMSFASGLIGLPKLQAAIEASPNVLFIAAAGNNANNADILKPEPCTLPLPNVICVTSTDENDNFAYFRVSAGPNYGAGTIDMAAPGANMLVAQQPVTTTFNDGFENDQLSSWLQSGELGNNWTLTSEISRTGGVSLRYFRSSPANVQGKTGAIRMANPIDLAGKYGCWLDGWVRSNIDKGYLFDVVGWTGENQYFSKGLSLVASTNGEWQHFMFPLDKEEAVGKLYIGFSLYEVYTGSAGALYVDDLSVTCNSLRFGTRDYGYAEGTSFSAPLVAGAAGLAFSYRPQATVAEVKSALLVGGTPSVSLFNKTRAPVRLDAYNTLLDLDLVSTDTNWVSISKIQSFEQSTKLANRSNLNGGLLLDLLLPAISAPFSALNDVRQLINWMASKKNQVEICSDPVATNNLDLANGNISPQVKSSLDKLGVTQQKIGQAPLCSQGCPYSFDKYEASFKVSGDNAITVDELFSALKSETPSGIMSNGAKGQLMKFINTFEYTDPDVLSGSRSPQVGDLMHINIAPPEINGGDVVIAEINDTDPNSKSLTVITVDNPNGAQGHPVWGTRTFGVKQEGDTMTVYTQGADSPGNDQVLKYGAPIQKLGWESFIGDIADQVERREIPGASEPQTTGNDALVPPSFTCP